MELIKKYGIQILILIIVSAIVCYLSLRYMQNEPKDPITSLVSEKVVEFKDKLKEDNARVETNKSEQLSGISKEEYQNLLNRYNDKTIEVNAFTNINSLLSDSLRIVKLDRDELKNKIWIWENKKPSGSTIKATMNEKDSILHTSVDVKLNITDVKEKGGLFKKDRFFTDFYSPDQNIKINGVQNFRKETIVKPKRLGLGIQVGYGVMSDLKPSIYVGVGASYNILNL